jgi:transposase-like protein
MNRTTLASLSLEINSEADAYVYLENMRWGDTPRCAHCQGTSVYFIESNNGVSRRTAAGTLSERRVWKCRPCKKQFSVLTGTILHATNISVRIWVMVIFEMCSAKNGLSAREVERKYGVCPRSAWHMLHRIRQEMDSPIGNLFTGDVIVDETWIGGDPANMHASKRHGRAGGGTDKTPVVSLVSVKTGEIRSTVVTHVDSASVRQAVMTNADLPFSTLHSDSARYYGNVASKMEGHFAVDHKAGQYVTEKSLGTQKCETFFSQLKRSIDGTHHHVTREHLHRYVGEFYFRYSTCKMTDTERMTRLGSQLEGWLTYKRVSA